MEIFSERLKQLREDKMREQENLGEKEKCSQRYMAKLLGVAQESYRRYENNTSEPNFTRLKILADYFEVSSDYLLGIKDDYF